MLIKSSSDPSNKIFSADNFMDRAETSIYQNFARSGIVYGGFNMVRRDPLRVAITGG
jgi:hypothetical protein